MPGKVNPVIPEVVLQIGAQVIGNDTAITVGGLQGNFELNVRIPLIARNLLGSIGLLTSASTLLARKCVDGIEANLEGCERSAEGTLAVATALNPYIGYDKASEIVKDASASGRTLREVAREHGVDEETLDKALDLRKIAAGNAARASAPPHLRVSRAAVPDKPAPRGTREGGCRCTSRCTTRVRLARAVVDLRRAAADRAVRAARGREAQGLVGRSRALAVVAIVVAIAVYSMPVDQALLSASEGAAFGLFPIMWIVVTALWIYNMTVATGEFAVLRRSFGAISDDQRVQAVIIAFCFGALLEALAGFGTPVAITAVMLIALGFAPIKAASVALVANTAPVAFGAIAIPIVTLAEITGLPKEDLGAMVGRQTPLLALFVPLILVGMVDGMRGIRQTWPAAVVGGLVFAIAQFATSNYISVELTDIVASLLATVSIVALLRVWQPSEPLLGEATESAEAAGRRSREPPRTTRSSRPRCAGDRKAASATRRARSRSPTRRTSSSSWSSRWRRSGRSRTSSRRRRRSSRGRGSTSATRTATRSRRSPSRSTGSPPRARCCSSPA